MTIIRDPKKLIKYTRLDLGQSLSTFATYFGVTGEAVRLWEEGHTEITENQVHKALKKALRAGDQAAIDLCLDLAMLQYRARQEALLSTANVADTVAEGAL